MFAIGLKHNGTLSHPSHTQLSPTLTVQQENGRVVNGCRKPLQPGLCSVLGPDWPPSTHAQRPGSTCKGPEKRGKSLTSPAVMNAAFQDTMSASVWKMNGCFQADDSQMKIRCGVGGMKMNRQVIFLLTPIQAT